MSGRNPKDKSQDSIYNNEIFRDFQQKYGTSLPKLSDEERRKMNFVLSAPTALLIDDGDVTFENWFLRLSTWGPIKITHKNPGEGINRVISPTEFIKYVDDQQRNASCGTWTMEETKLNKTRLYRKFDDIRGRAQRFLVGVEYKRRCPTNREGVFNPDGWEFIF